MFIRPLITGFFVMIPPAAGRTMTGIVQVLDMFDYWKYPSANLNRSSVLSGASFARDWIAA